MEDPNVFGTSDPSLNKVFQTLQNLEPFSGKSRHECEKLLERITNKMYAFHPDVNLNQDNLLLSYLILTFPIEIITYLQTNKISITQDIIPQIQSITNPALFAYYIVIGGDHQNLYCRRLKEILEKDEFDFIESLNCVSLSTAILSQLDERLSSQQIPQPPSNEVSSQTSQSQEMYNELQVTLLETALTIFALQRQAVNGDQLYPLFVKYASETMDDDSFNTAFTQVKELLGITSAILPNNLEEIQSRKIDVLLKIFSSRTDSAIQTEKYDRKIEFVKLLLISLETTFFLVDLQKKIELKEKLSSMLNKLAESEYYIDAFENVKSDHNFLSVLEHTSKTNSMSNIFG